MRGLTPKQAVLKALLALLSEPVMIPPWEEGFWEQRALYHNEIQWLKAKAREIQARKKVQNLNPGVIDHWHN